MTMLTMERRRQHKRTNERGNWAGAVCAPKSPTVDCAQPAVSLSHQSSFAATIPIVLWLPRNNHTSRITTTHVDAGRPCTRWRSASAIQAHLAHVRHRARPERKAGWSI